MSSSGRFHGTDAEFEAIIENLPSTFGAGHWLPANREQHERTVHQWDDGTKVIWYHGTKGGLNFQGRRHAELSQAWKRTHDARTSRTETAAARPPVTASSVATSRAATSTASFGASVALAPASSSPAASVVSGASTSAAVSISSSTDGPIDFCVWCGFPRMSRAHTFCRKCGKATE